MEELKYPLTTKQVVCHNGKDLYHFVTVEPNQVCTTGQPYMGVYASKTTLNNKVKTLAMAAKNQEDYQAFINPDKAELMAIIEELI